MEPRLKEDRMVAALKRLAETARRRANAKHALAEIEKEHKRALLAALKSGVTTRRAAEVGELSPDTVNRWNKEQKAKQEADPK
ncbi:hypothetical protein AB0F17_65715 [Nonomuraea sp. NPDC026600]|uniref:hypothetical protein n=1 Tax=Nonomuraea sp. NPDC026600 TaxID=3155363 RepID=UPI0034079FFB